MVWVSHCDLKVDASLKHTRKLFSFTVNAHWGEWGPWTNCSKSCGSGGNYFRQRTCDSPPALFGGEPCEGIDGHWDECYVEPCDSKWYKQVGGGEGRGREGGWILFPGLLGGNPVKRLMAIGMSVMDNHVTVSEICMNVVEPGGGGWKWLVASPSPLAYFYQIICDPMPFFWGQTVQRNISIVTGSNVMYKGMKVSKILRSKAILPKVPSPPSSPPGLFEVDP